MQPYRFLWFDKLTNQACRKAGYGLTQLSHSSALNRSPKHLKMLSTKTQCLSVTRVVKNVWRAARCVKARMEGEDVDSRRRTRSGRNGRLATLPPEQKAGVYRWM